MGIASAHAFGGMLRGERKSRGLTQVQLAELAGVSRAWLARFENGHQAASLEPVFRVLRALDLELTLRQRHYSPEEAEVLAALAEQDAREAGR